MTGRDSKSLASYLTLLLTAACFVAQACTVARADDDEPSSQASEGGEMPTVSPLTTSNYRKDGPKAKGISQIEGKPGFRIPLDDPSGQAMARLHESLREAQAGEGKARLVFYGASHVASDAFTGFIREELQTRFGDGGHGFILPVKPWRYYRHRGIEIESDWKNWKAHRIKVRNQVIDRYGLAGVAVESDRKGSYGALETAKRGDIGRSASRYEVWFMKQPKGGDFHVFVDGKRVKTVSTKADARENGYESFDVADGSHRFEVKLVGNGPVRIYGSTVERGDSGVVVDTLGINGARARYQNLWHEETFREQLKKREPSLVALAYGTNEAGDTDVPLEYYESRLRKVVARIKNTAPEASCLLIGPSDRPLRDKEAETIADRPRTLQLNEIQRRVSHDYGCAYFDVVAFMGGPLSMVEWVNHDPAFGAPDHIHFTRRGYEHMGEVLFHAMLDGFGDMPTKQ